MKIFKRVCLSKCLILIVFMSLIGLALDAAAFETKSSRENGVKVDVTPVEFAPGKAARFQIRINTHSGDLSQNMVEVSMLRDDKGREYRPVRWEGSPPGGHHRRGVLEFPSFEGKSKKITLIVRDIANVPERLFEWEIK
jgi:hypothetical protein